MKPAPFAYYRPRTLEDALALLGEHGEDCKILAGGQSLVPMLSMRMARPSSLVDINRVGDLDEIRIEGGRLRIGALARQADVHRSREAQSAPLLMRAMPFIGHWQTRNRGTVCGSLAHADPSAELPLVAIALAGEIEARSVRGSRRIPAHSFFSSFFTTVLEPDEMIVAASLEVARERSGYAFEEFAERHGDFAIVATACALRLDAAGALEDLRIVLGGVGERPVVAGAGPRLGTQLTDHDVHAIAAETSDALEPPNDRRGSADYRRWLARGQITRAMSRALREAAG